MPLNKLDMQSQYRSLKRAQDELNEAMVSAGEACSIAAKTRDDIKERYLRVSRIIEEMNGMPEIQELYSVGEEFGPKGIVIEVVEDKV